MISPDDRQASQDSRVLDRLDKIFDGLASVTTKVEVTATDLRHHRREFLGLKTEIAEIKKELRQVRDERQISKGMKTLGAAVITILGAAGGAVASFLNSR